MAAADPSYLLVMCIVLAVASVYQIYEAGSQFVCLSPSWIIILSKYIMKCFAFEIKCLAMFLHLGNTATSCVYAIPSWELTSFIHCKLLYQTPVDPLSNSSGFKKGLWVIYFLLVVFLEELTLVFMEPVSNYFLCLRKPQKRGNIVVNHCQWLIL